MKVAETHVKLLLRAHVLDQWYLTTATIRSYKNFVGAKAARSSGW